MCPFVRTHSPLITDAESDVTAAVAVVTVLPSYSTHTHIAHKVEQKGNNKHGIHGAILLNENEWAEPTRLNRNSVDGTRNNGNKSKMIK